MPGVDVAEGLRMRRSRPAPRGVFQSRCKRHDGHGQECSDISLFCSSLLILSSLLLLRLLSLSLLLRLPAGAGKLEPAIEGQHESLLALSFVGGRAGLSAGLD